MTLLLRRVTTEISGLNIKTKVGGTWQTATPHDKVSGTWEKVKKAYAKVGGSWQTTYEY